MNITCRFYADTVTVQKPSRFSIREVLYQLQQKIMQTYTTELNERDAGILSTLVAGSNAQLDAQTKESYRKAGISHILAVSGLHISVFGFSVYRFLRRCRRSYPCAALLSSLCVIDFAMMSGFGVSAQRAVIMYLCIMGAEILGRKYDASWTGAGCLYHFASQSLCNLSEWIFIFFYSITCDYGIFRSAIG